MRAPSVLWLLLLAPLSAEAARVKDLVTVRGVRSNPLTGYGLVVGLAGTGDTRRSTFTESALSSLLRREGLQVPPERLAVPNVAAVLVTADLPPFSGLGEPLDVIVSAAGTAKSLEGGVLLLTALKGADGQVYAVAQGPLVLGGFGAQGGQSKVQKNSVTVGRIPNGALVERTVPASFVVEERITLSLREADFSTALRIAQAINTLTASAAQALDPGTVVVQVPPSAAKAPVALMSAIELLEVEPDRKARVIISERTGTVVVGAGVRLSAAAVAHGNLNVSIKTDLEASQPGPFSGGTTAITPKETLEVSESKSALVPVGATATVDELVRALNALGASPRDLVAILQSLHAAGSLSAELVVQ